MSIVMDKFYVIITANSENALAWVRDILTGFRVAFAPAYSAVGLRQALDDRTPDLLIDVTDPPAAWVETMRGGIRLLQPMQWADVSDTPRSAAGLRAVRLKSELEALLHDSAVAKKAEAPTEADDYGSIDEEERRDEFRGGIPQDLLDRMEGGESTGSAPPPPPRARPVPPPAPPMMPQPGAPPAPIAPPLPEPEFEIDQLLPEPEAAPANEPIQFSAYYPREVKPDEWQPLLAYVFRESAVDAVGADVQNQLGDQLTRFRTVADDSSQPIAEGAMITATPQIPGVRFNPPSISVGFYEDWHRFDFKLMAKDAPPDLAANGQITFTVEGIIVADLPLSVFVSHSATPAETLRQTSARPYQAIFASYSRDDLAIVERVERAYRALGLEYLRDLITIRSGENWTQRLTEMINQADIFQLFWSRTSAESEFVKMEWAHALAIHKARGHFIRPVYWQEPMPTVPPELMHIHFTYQPDLAT